MVGYVHTASVKAHSQHNGATTKGAYRRAAAPSRWRASSASPSRRRFSRVWSSIKSSALYSWHQSLHGLPNCHTRASTTSEGRAQSYLNPQLETICLAACSS